MHSSAGSQLTGTTQRLPPRSPFRRCSPLPFVLMLSSRSTVRNPPKHYSQCTYHLPATNREHRQEQEAGVRCEREGRPPDLCRVLGYWSCSCSYSSRRWWRYPPFRPGMSSCCLFIMNGFIETHTS